MTELIVEIDYRERKRSTSVEKTVPEYLEKLGVPVEFKELSIGDFKIQDYICERKSAVDYINSKQNNHLNNQLYDLSVNLPISFLFIEGNLRGECMKRWFSDTWEKSSFLGTCLKRAEEGVGGIVIPIVTLGAKDTAKWIKVIYDKVKSGEFRRFPEIERDGKFKPSDKEWMVFIVSSFPNIGKNRAIELIKKYKTLRNLFTSTEWQATGVGRKTNSNVQELLDYEYN